MNNSKLRIWLPLAVFTIQWIIWGVWQNFAMPRLPGGIAAALLESVAVKSLVWAAPFVAFLCICKSKQIRFELFKAPFPWFPCVIMLCLTTAFLYTVRLAEGLMNTHAVFDPMFLVYSLSAGVIEEFNFRGGLFSLQESVMSFWPAAIINGFLFTIYHYPEILFGESLLCLLSLRALLIFAMGIIFCRMFWKWRNLALNMTVHTVWDILSFLFCIAG